LRLQALCQRARLNHQRRRATSDAEVAGPCKDVAHAAMPSDAVPCYRRASARSRAGRYDRLSARGDVASGVEHPKKDGLRRGGPLTWSAKSFEPASCRAAGPELLAAPSTRLPRVR